MFLYHITLKETIRTIYIITYIVLHFFCNKTLTFILIT